MICETNPFSRAVEAREIIEERKIDYNTKRSPSSLNGLTPTLFAARPTREGQNEVNWGRRSEVVELKALAT